MKHLILLSISFLVIKAGAFAEVSAKSKLKILIVENKLDEAKIVADQEIENNPDNIELLSKRGIIHFMQGDYQSAIDDFTAYLATNPGNAKCYLYRGLANIALGNEKSGKEDIKIALSLKPNLLSLLHELKTQIKKK